MITSIVSLPCDLEKNHFKRIKLSKNSLKNVFKNDKKIFDREIKEIIENIEENPEIDSDEYSDNESLISTDYVFAATAYTNDYSSIQTYVYNSTTNGIHLNDEIVLDNNPISIETIDTRSASDESSKGLYLAVGTMEGVIDIWDSSLNGAVAPICTLGKENNSSVLSLKHNSLCNNLLLSSNSKFSCKIHDLNTSKLHSIYKFHSKKVNNIQWHPFECNLFVSCSDDKYLCLWDLRSNQPIEKWQSKSPINCLEWNQIDPFKLNVGQKNGRLKIYDIKLNKPLKSIKHSTKSIEAICCSSFNPNQLVSIDSKQLVLWDQNNLSFTQLAKIDCKKKLICVNPVKSQKINCFLIGSKSLVPIVTNLTDYQQSNTQIS